ncbi:hypothetical protein SO802_018484 [Lithocarpus litseifolius]|uniref:Small ribosomal subunit protein mS29 n=1 Tax=Lithocarpus litseifolius TaxID=425828 RepID=A0AAW2CKW0_9ROSI
MSSPPLPHRARRASSRRCRTGRGQRSGLRSTSSGAAPYHGRKRSHPQYGSQWPSSLHFHTFPLPSLPQRHLLLLQIQVPKSKFKQKPTCIYSLIIDNLVIFVWIWISMESLKSALPEGLPTGMVKEFEDSLRPALLICQSFLDLHDNFHRIVDPPLTLSHSKGPKLRKQVVLDGPVSCGKSIALAMLVHWARDEGWLVFYVPRGRDWTHGGFFYKNPNTGLWDTPLQAENVLKDFLKCNESHL